MNTNCTRFIPVKRGKCGNCGQSIDKHQSDITWVIQAAREIEESQDVTGALAALAKFEKATKPANDPLTQANLF